MITNRALFVEPGFLVYDIESANMAQAVVDEFAGDEELVGAYASELARWKVGCVGRTQKSEKEAGKKGEKAREEENVLDMMHG